MYSSVIACTKPMLSPGIETEVLQWLGSIKSLGLYLEGVLEAKQTYITGQYI
jgi:hypothetical protein